MSEKKKFLCPSCSKEYKSLLESGIRVRCGACKFRFFIPFTSATSLVEWFTFSDLKEVGSFLANGQLNLVSSELRHTTTRIYEMRRWNQQELERNHTERLRFEKLEERSEIQKDKNQRLKSHVSEIEEKLIELQKSYSVAKASLSDVADLETNISVLQQDLDEARSAIDLKEKRIIELSSAEEEREALRLEELRKRVKRNELKKVREKKKRSDQKKQAEVIYWARNATWSELDEFMLDGRAKGLSTSLIDRLVEIHTNRRWNEEDKIRREIDRKNKLTRKETIEIARREEIIQIHEELSGFSPSYVQMMSGRDFESFVARLFRAFGYSCEVVGGGFDEGIDVSIWLGSSLYAVAQCKRYADKSVSASQVRDFIGAYMATNAKKAFFFTTSQFTSAARKTAANFSCMDIYDLEDLQVFVSNAQKTIERENKV